MLAVHADGLRPTDGLIAANTMKQIFREMKLFDASVTSKDSLTFSSNAKRWGITNKTADKASDDEVDGADTDSALRPKLLSKQSPMMVAFYGMICMCAKSYQSAICMSKQHIRMRSID